MSTALPLVLVALALVSTFGAGLELRGVFEARVVWRALLANVVLVPLAGWAVLSVAPLADVGQLALWLVAVAPGGASSPLLARSAGAPGPTTGLTYLVLAVLSAALMPLGVWLWGRPLPSWVLGATVLVQLVPLAAGALVARRRPALVRLAGRLRTAGNALLVSTVVLLAVERGPALLSLDQWTVVALLVLCAATVAAGALVGTPRAGFAVLTVVRNLTLALLVGEALAPGSPVTLLVATYGLVMYVAAGALVLLRTRSVRDGPVEAKP